MAGVTLRAVLGQPTNLLVVQYRRARPRARTQIAGTGGVVTLWPPLRLAARNHRVAYWAYD